MKQNKWIIKSTTGPRLIQRAVLSSVLWEQKKIYTKIWPFSLSLQFSFESKLWLFYFCHLVFSYACHIFKRLNILIGCTRKVSSRNRIASIFFSSKNEEKNNHFNNLKCSISFVFVYSFVFCQLFYWHSWREVRMPAQEVEKKAPSTLKQRKTEWKK